MKKVLSYDTVIEAEFAAGLLRSREIPCEVRNEAIAISGGLATPLPFFPEVWVMRDQDLPAAIELLEHHPKTRAPAWTCSKCGNQNEAAFDACWSCGADRPESVT